MSRISCLSCCKEIPLAYWTERRQTKASDLRNGNYIPPRSEIKLTEEVKQTMRLGNRDRGPLNINLWVNALLFVFPLLRVRITYRWPGINETQFREVHFRQEGTSPPMVLHERCRRIPYSQKSHVS